VPRRSFSRLAGPRQRSCGAGGGGRSKAPKAKVTRSNRVGCARKAYAEGAGTVAGKIFERRQFFWKGHVTAISFKLLPLSGHSGNGQTCCWFDPVVIDPGYVETPTRGECAELFSLFSSFDDPCRAVLFLFNVIETKVPRESSRSESPHSLDPQATSSVLVTMPTCGKGACLTAASQRFDIAVRSPLPASVCSGWISARAHSSNGPVLKGVAYG
jgi:hypothetical protein